jgi:hypothetical protein
MCLVHLVYGIRVVLGVKLAGLVAMVLGMEVVRVSDVGVVGRLLVVAGVVRLGGLAVVLGGVLVVLRGLVVMLQLLLV